MMQRGHLLQPSAQSYVLRAYVHRNTRENPHRHIGGSTLPPISDAQWLRITSFAVLKDGRLDPKAKFCDTHHHEVPAWAAMIDAWARSRIPAV